MYSGIAALAAAASAGPTGFLAGLAAMRSRVRRVASDAAHARWLADHDALTGLPNRSSARHMYQRAAQAGRPPAVVLLDLDDFKTVNDTWGHHVGDAHLVAVAERLVGSCRAIGATACRLGGDEFLLLVPMRAGGEGGSGVSGAAGASGASGAAGTSGASRASGAAAGHAGVAGAVGNSGAVPGRSASSSLSGAPGACGPDCDEAEAEDGLDVIRAVTGVVVALATALPLTVDEVRTVITHPSASAGVAVAEAEESFSDTLRHADIALYHAKREHTAPRLYTPDLRQPTSHRHKAGDLLGLHGHAHEHGHEHGHRHAPGHVHGGMSTGSVGRAVGETAD